MIAVFQSDDITNHILSYINPLELGNVRINTHFDRLIRSEVRWKYFFGRDFHINIPLYTSAAEEDDDPRFERGFRNAYLETYTLVKTNTSNNFDQMELATNESQSERDVHYQNCIDFCQLRCLLPLPLLCAFITIILLAIKIDGHDTIPYWACFTPLLIFLVYLLCSILFIIFLHRYKTNFPDLWQYMSGPLRVIWGSTMGDSCVYVGLFLGTVLLLLLQIALIILKLSSTGFMEFSWGIIFAPLWICFSIFCLLPIVKCINMLLYCTALVLWIPLFALFISLACKLDIEEKNLPVPKILTVEIFVPFWLLEFILLTGTLVAVAHSINSMRAQIEDARDYFFSNISICLCTWCLIGPVVLFQILLSIKDIRNNISTTSCVLPLLIFFGLTLLWVLIFVVLYRTPYQEYQALRAQRDIGKHVIWRI